MNNEQPTLGLKWTWYIFLLSNIVMILGIALTWILVSKEALEPRIVMLPITVCNLISLLGISIFFYFDSKDVWLVKHHVPSKWILIYFSSAFIFTFTIIFNFIYMSFYSSLNQTLQYSTVFLILIIVSSVFSVTSIGFYRFGRYKIDLTIYRRKRGVDTISPTIQPHNNHSPKILEKVTTSDAEASSKLVDRASKK